MIRIIALTASAAFLAGCAAHEPMAERTVYFGFDRETLTAEAIEQLAYLQKDAAREGAAGVTIVGHADTVSDAGYNQGLSLRRAETVRRDLIARGAPADSVTLVPLGETAPAVATGDEIMEPENRFATIQLSDFGARAAPDRTAPYRVALPPEMPSERRPRDAAMVAADEAMAEGM